MPRVTGLCTAPRVVSTAYVRQVANVPHPPPLRNLAQFGVFEGVREQFCDFGFKLWAGGAADLLIGPVGVRAADGALARTGSKSTNQLLKIARAISSSVWFIFGSARSCRPACRECRRWPAARGGAVEESRFFDNTSASNVDLNTSCRHTDQ